MIYIKFAIEEETVDADMYQFLEDKANGGSINKAAYLAIREAMLYQHKYPPAYKTSEVAKGKRKEYVYLIFREGGLHKIG